MTLSVHRFEQGASVLNKTMKGDLLELSESKSIIDNFTAKFGSINGVLLLDKSHFCIGC